MSKTIRRNSLPIIYSFSLVLCSVFQCTWVLITTVSFFFLKKMGWGKSTSNQLPEFFTRRHVMLLGGEVLPSLAWASLGLLECTVCSLPTAGLAMCLKMIKRAVQKATVINPLMLNTFVSRGCLEVGGYASSYFHGMC